MIRLISMSNLGTVTLHTFTGRPFSDFVASRNNLYAIWKPYGSNFSTIGAAVCDSW